MHKIVRFLKKYQLLVFCFPALMVIFRMVRFVLKKKTSRIDSDAITRTKQLLAGILCITTDMKKKPIHAFPSPGFRARSFEEIQITPQQMIVMGSIHSRSAESFEKLKNERQSHRDAIYPDSDLSPVARRNMKRRATIDSKIQKVRGERLKKVLSQCCLAVIREE